MWGVQNPFSLSNSLEKSASRLLSPLKIILLAVFVCFWLFSVAFFFLTRLCKTVLWCESHIVELNFAQWLKKYLPLVWYVDEAKTHSFQDLKENSINLILWSGTRHWKRHTFLIDLLRDLKIYDGVELVFPSDKFQTLRIFNMFICSFSIPGYLWPTQSRGLFLFSMNI